MIEPPAVSQGGWDGGDVIALMIIAISVLCVLGLFVELIGI